jgi:MFS family permease
MDIQHCKGNLTPVPEALRNARKTLGNGGFQIFQGPLSDRRGRRDGWGRAICVHLSNPFCVSLVLGPLMSLVIASSGSRIFDGEAVGTSGVFGGSEVFGGWFVFVS